MKRKANSKFCAQIIAYGMRHAGEDAADCSNSRIYNAYIGCIRCIFHWSISKDQSTIEINMKK
jgi:hypothetical protein